GLVGVVVAAAGFLAGAWFPQAAKESIKRPIIVLMGDRTCQTPAGSLVVSSGSMTERIGIIVGMEDSFPAAFVEKVNQTPGFRGEILRIGGVRERPALTHRVIVDRLSHEVP